VPGHEVVDHAAAHLVDRLADALLVMNSRRCSNTTLRWSFMTLSYLRMFLRVSKLRASTFCCAFSTARLIQGWTIASSP
jgi:hypothetical protein